MVPIVYKLILVLTSSKAARVDPVTESAFCIMRILVACAHVNVV